MRRRARLLGLKDSLTVWAQHCHRRLKLGASFLIFLAAYSAFATPQRIDAMPRQHHLASPTPQPQAAVIDVSLISASRAASLLRTLFPRARVEVDSSANAVLVVAPPDDVQQMRAVVQGIDVRNPESPINDVIELHVLKPGQIIPRLRLLYPSSRIEATAKDKLLIRASRQDDADIKSLLTSLDVAPPTPVATAQPEEALSVRFAKPRTLARALAQQVPHLRASVSGSTIVIAGSPDEIDRAKTLAQALDAPPFGTTYTQVYRLHAVDAKSVGDLIRSSYKNVGVTVDADLNALSVLGTAAEQERIAAAISQLDAVGSSGQPMQQGASAYGGGNVDVVQLESAMPGQNGSPSTSAQDIANAVQQALQSMAPDLRLTVPANTSEIVLAGNPMSIRLARSLIERLDQPQALVVLDTEVLEVDENAARNIGLQFPGASLQTVFEEIQPTPNPLTGQQGRLIGLQPLSRTALQFSAELNFLVTHGNARVLADPRVTTISGHTATIRAGDTINILTQTAGGVGTPVTQQLQTFNTGVTLDITPQVGPSGNVTVALHPVVNSLAGLLNGVPQIATRDTQTVVQLQDNETLVIGGLIQETYQHQVSKLPLLGDIPLIGRLFQNADVQSDRNELVIVVTPHIIKRGTALPAPDAVLPLPTAQPLPTLPPSAQLPTPRAEPSPVAVPTPSPAGALVFTPLPTPTTAPVPTPTAFANTNVFVYGSPPPNTFAGQTDTPQIFYVQFSPTVLRNGTPVQVFVVTTTNVRKVEVGYPGYMTTLSEVAPSKWQGIYNFNASGLVSSQQTFNLNLNAYGPSGGAATVQIPVGLLR